MKWTGAKNKGKDLTVEPIRSQKAVSDIKSWLARNAEPMHYLLFVAGINNGLRVSDLRRLIAGQLRGANEGQAVPVKESKTGKRNYFYVNRAVANALAIYWRAYPNLLDKAPVFFSVKGGALSSQRIGDLIKYWCQAAGLKGKFGAHTLRKTWAYHQRVNFNTDWSLITERLNHSHPAITRAYLGIQAEEVAQILKNCI